MLTKLTVRNFKRFGNVEIELGNPVVFMGPNDSGKTTALQALALWHIGLRKWNEKRAGKAAPERRPGVTINRRDLIAVPVPDANLLWRDLHVRDVSVVGGKQQTRNIRVDILVEGVIEGKSWTCGLEFDYANEESFYCRPLRLSEERNPERMPIPDGASGIHVAFLPPMSGLAANETRLDPGAVNVRLGEGRTAEVLRNLCHQIINSEQGPERWTKLCEQIEGLFGVALEEPQYIKERGEIVMTYRTRRGVRLDLSSSGRGMQQTLLLLAHLTVNPGTVLLLDEPDAHLEILRQRQIYELLTEAAREHRSQIVAASHSEVVLNEAGGRDVVVAFLGKPHRIDDRGSQLLKSLREIGFVLFYHAEQTGWVLYLEGPSDLEILRAFAETLDHPVRTWLHRPYVHYIQNQPQKARDHFRGLREAKHDLVGFTLCDRLDRDLQPTPELEEYMWERREIENYLCQRETLMTWAREAGTQQAGSLFAARWTDMMGESIGEIEEALGKLGKGSPLSPNMKVSDEFFDPLFKTFFKKLGLPNLMQKTDYHVLARHVGRGQIDPEVSSVLNLITRVAGQAKPLRDEDAS